VANNFSFSIQAVDRYTKVFRDLNNKASKAALPLLNVQRQAGALAREMHLDKVAKGMGAVSDAAVNVSRTLGLSLGPLEAMLGAGGGIVGSLLAGGVAMVALGVRTASTGFEIARTSQAIGMSTRDLQRWQGAAKLASVDADAMTETLDGLGKTLQDASQGRDTGALNALRWLRIGIPMKNGIVDQNAALEGIAQGLSRISDPQLRNVVARALHIRPEVIPLLAQGADGVHRLQEQAERYGLVLSPEVLQRTADFTTSLHGLGAAAEAVGLSFGSKMLVPMTRAMDSVSKGFGTEGLSGGLQSALKLVPLPSTQIAARELGLFFGGPKPTTSVERTVSGQIGGTLQQGPYAKPAASSSTAAPAGVVRSKAEEQMAGQMAFTPAELARQQADEDSAENRRQLVSEIQRTRDPAARSVLQDELTKLDQRVHVEVTLKNAPAGTTATARVASADAATSTARVQFAMPSGDMP